MRNTFGEALYKDPGATLKELRKAVTTLEDLAQTARRVLGDAHPDVVEIEESLRDARVKLCVRETPSPGSA